MDVGIQSLWIILTVMVPGLVFSGTLWSLLYYINETPLVIGILSPPTDLPQSDIVYLCIIFAIMFILQIVGIATESIFFSQGPYRHPNKRYQDAFEKRYVIISTMDPEKDYHVERILSQFFMSHNIAVGLTINLIWVCIYLFLININLNFNNKLIFILLLLITILSWYVSYRRFFLSCDVLYAHLQKYEACSDLLENKLSSTSLSTSLNKEIKKAEISYNSIVIASIFVFGGIGYIFYHLWEGFLAGFALGFLAISKLRDSIKVVAGQKKAYPKKEISIERVKYLILVLIIILITIFAIEEETMKSFINIKEGIVSIVLIILGLGIALSGVISIKTDKTSQKDSFLEVGNVKWHGASIDTCPKYTIKFLNEYNLKDIIKLQRIIVHNLPDHDLYQPASVDILKERLSKEHFVIGVETGGELIAFGIIHIPGDKEDNLGRDICMSDTDLEKVAHLQFIIVHPDYRGNSFQEKLAKYQLDIIKDLGYVHVLATVSPKNYHSLRNMLKLGFVIRDIKLKYDGVLRCIMYRSIVVNANPAWQNVVEIKGSDIEGQKKILREGFVGFDISDDQKDFLIYYAKSQAG